MAIMVRAEITEAEWVELRKLALDLNRSSKEIVGALIRDFLTEKGKKNGSETA